MIETNVEFLKKDLEETAAFFSARVDARHIFKEAEGKCVNTVIINGKAYAFGNVMPRSGTETEKKRYIKRYACLSLYKALVAFTGEKQAWGALTGVRPTKPAYAEIEKTGDFKEFFTDVMKVSPEKTLLTAKVIEAQKGLYEKPAFGEDFFVFIPFCPSRCRYCSFITADVKTAAKHVDDYVNALVYEIKQSAKLITRLRSVYVGGGTPVSLSDDNLEKILCAIDEVKPFGTEYTVEAGRPDRITESNLALLKKHGVTRVCVNPQTFNDETLVRIGRKHTAAEIIEKYELAKKDFIVNMDLIAGLDGETKEDFFKSVLKAIELAPDNITIHTLSVKRGSYLAEEGKRLPKGDIEEMISFAEKRLEESGYSPYYLYRQKYMAGNLENVGYAKKGTECLYNVDVMEEAASVIACGAGAISKRVAFNDDKIERLAAPKDVVTYVNKLSEILSSKQTLFGKND